MEISKLSTNFNAIEQPSLAFGYLTTNLILITITLVVLFILRIMNSILEPMNYELDMTSKNFCKTLAEIDNNLRFRRGNEGELQLHATDGSSNQRGKKSTNCATELLNDSDSHSTDSKNNNNNYGKSTKTSINTGSANHVYPNGWIPVIESFKVRAGEVKKAIILGRDVIVTRSADGHQVNVLDAYCPHMGVHIGIGGRVREVDKESCVECPFHGWTFRSSDGQCVKVPYQKSGTRSGIPKQAKLGSWISAEVDNFIYIWHHIDNEPPSWHLAPSIQLTYPNWQFAGRSCHKTNLEIRDMHENGADMNHFEGIHNDIFILGGHITKLRPLNYLQEYTRHHWLPEWRPILDESGKMTHRAQMKLQSWISLFKLRTFDITVHAVQIGPARVDLCYNSEWYGRGLLIMNAIPMGGRRTKYVQHLYAERTLFQCFMSKWVLYGEIKMLERDFFIWNHKKNIKNPIFVPEDKTLKQFRLWYSQFYRRKRKIIVQDSENIAHLHNDEDLNCKAAVDF